MILIALFKPEDLMQLIEQPSMEKHKSWVTFDYAIQLASHKYAFTIFKGLKPIACIGLIEYWAGRFEAWAFLSEDSKTSFVAIHKAVRKFIKHKKLRRLEAVVAEGHEEGHRWAELLGFKLECEEMKGYGFNGESFSLYSIVEGN